MVKKIENYLSEKVDAEKNFKNLSSKLGVYASHWMKDIEGLKSDEKKDKNGGSVIYASNDDFSVQFGLGNAKTSTAAPFVYVELKKDGKKHYFEIRFSLSRNEYSYSKGVDKNIDWDVTQTTSLDKVFSSLTSDFESAAK